MLQGRKVLCCMLGWYLFGREVGTISDVRLVFLDDRLVVSNVRLVLVGM
jgi:hypothetical protein